MASTAHSPDSEYMPEFQEDPKVLAQHAKQMANMIRKAKHFVVFTGAGVSTSCGIPDFRGPEGVWTLQAQGRARTAPTVSTTKAIPSVTHMSLVALQNAGLLKYLISQNCDGLHRRSGINPANFSELHGNTNLEFCIKCKREYLRDSHVRNNPHVHKHNTGRICAVPGCGGELHDTIINFGENLPEVPLQKAYDNSDKADVHLVLGSSLTVTPACSNPKRTAKRGGKLVICNLQKTPLDSYASMRVHARCDDFMKLVMQELGLSIPPFLLYRRFQFEEKGDSLTISGVDVDGTPMYVLRGLDYSLDGSKQTSLKKEPFVIPLKNAKRVDMQFTFMGHYNEPNLPQSYVPHQTAFKEIREFWYNPLNGLWKGSIAEHLQLLGNPSDDLTSSMDRMDLTNSSEDTVSSSTSKVHIGNTHQVVSSNDSNTHRWTMYVEEEQEGKIDSVTFDLHPTFRDPQVVISRAPFAVTRTGWGTFDIGVQVKLKSGTVHKFTHHLNFDQSKTEQVVTI